MKYKQVRYPDSIVVKSILYNYDKNIMQVYFVNGDEIHYDFDKPHCNINNITLEFVEQSLKTRPSVGSFFHCFIKDKFENVKVDVPLLFGYYMSNIDTNKGVECFDDYVAKYVKDINFRNEVNTIENIYIPSKVGKKDV